MKPYIIVLGILFCILTVSGCSDNYILQRSSTVQTVNGTFYDPSRSFELLKFCSSSSISENSDPFLLNCSLGQITVMYYNNVTGNWSCMSCVWDSSKCLTQNVSDILGYTGLNLTSEHILSMEYSGGFYVQCCNVNGAMCYSRLITDNNFSVCNAGYNELVGSMTFDNVTNNWSVTSCLNGFK